MKFNTVVAKPEDVKTDLLILTIFKDQKDLPLPLKKIDVAIGNKITKALKDKDFIAKKGKSIIFDGTEKLSAKKVGLIGLGEKKDFNPDIVRLVAANAVKAAKKLRCSNAAIQPIDGSIYETLEGAFFG